MRLNGMTAVVTGGASGIGESMVYALAKEGASIVVVDRNAEGANTVATNVERESGKAISVKAHVQSTEDLDTMSNKAMDTFGRINILVNNAGARVIKGFLEHTLRKIGTRCWVLIFLVPFIAHKRLFQK